MASPPFDVLEAKPANTDIVSQHPADERSMRDIVESALAIEHDMGAASTDKAARHKFGVGNDATRDAITTWVVGSIWFNTKTSPATLQRVVSVGPVVWEDVVAGGGGFTSPLTTRGDLLTRSASAHVRLALGAANRVLRSDGTDPSWGQIVTADITALNITTALLAAANVTLEKIAANTLRSFIFCQSGAIGAGVTTFISPGGGGAEAAVQFPVANECTLRRLQVRCETAPGAGQSYVYTVRRNGADAGITATISGTNTTASDPTNTQAYNSGNNVAVKVVASAGAAGTGAHWATLEAIAT